VNTFIRNAARVKDAGVSLNYHYSSFTAEYLFYKKQNPDFAYSMLKLSALKELPFKKTLPVNTFQKKSAAEIAPHLWYSLKVMRATAGGAADARPRQFTVESGPARPPRQFTVEM